MASNNSEAVIDLTHPIEGYCLIPKGNVYITANARRLTKAAGQPVYKVVNKSNKDHVGIRVPVKICDQVLVMEKGTRQKRMEAVQKKDDATAKGFEHAILDQFPNISRACLPKIVQHALEKGSRRVARNMAVDPADRVILAVHAHARHCHTEYEKLLAGGMSRENARAKIALALSKVMKTWRGSKADLWGEAIYRDGSPSTKGIDSV